MKRSTKLIGISGLLGFILILAVLYLFYRQNILWTYKDPGKEFKIKYPATWEVKPNYGGSKVLFASPLIGPLDYFQENVSVVIQDTSKFPMNLEEYTEEAIRQMELVFMHNFILEESSAVATLGGLPAYKIIFTGKGPETDLMYYIIWTVVDKVTAYQVTFTALPSQFDKYFGIADSMIQSFELR